MKRVFILLASVVLLVSCTKAIDIEDEGGKTPTDPSKSTTEFTLNTMANLTRAIAEGKDVPGDNYIGLFPRFFSEKGTVDYESYNNLMTFGYDAGKGVWRGIAGSTDYETKGILDEVRDEVFRWNPFYWPGGDRVAMDYVSFSYYNLKEVLVQALKYYSGGLFSMSSDVREIADLVMDVYPMIYNENRVDVWYQNTVLNLLSFALTMSFQSPVLHPAAVISVLALSAVYEEKTGFAIDDEPITLAEIKTMAPDLMQMLSKAMEEEKEKEKEPADPMAADTLVADTPMVADWARAYTKGGESEAAADSAAVEEVKEELPASIQNFLQRDTNMVKFVVNYVLATRMIEKGSHSAEGKLTKADFNEAINRGYRLFMNNLPKVSKRIQDDLMYAYGRSQRNSGGPIQVKYNHAKAWVKVLVNNQTENDIFISNLVFDDVKTRGTLVIDNSKSAFEAYWDFTGEVPVKPEEPEEPEDGDREYGLTFDPYTPVTLGGTPAAEHPVGDWARPAAWGLSTKSNSGKEAEEAKPSKNPLGNLNFEDGEMGEMVKKLFTMGFIPDVYLAPAGCYGPAARIGLSDIGSESVIAAAATAAAAAGGDIAAAADSAAAAADPAAAVMRRLQLDCVSGSNPVDDKVIGLAANLGGAMFPAQEPGTITISYYPVLRNEKQVARGGMVHGLDAGEEQTLPGGLVRREFEMGEVSEYLYDNLKESDLQTVTLNLPRQTWQMGKVYIYVITITGNEITIGPAIEKEWEAVPVVYPTGPSIPGGTETILPGDGSIFGWN